MVLFTFQGLSLLQWIPHIDTYVEEVLRLEGLGDATEQTYCAGTDCQEPISASCHRCRDCFDSRVFCTACTIQKHRSLPLHRIEVSVQNFI